MPYVRAIGRWSMTALVVNSVIGSGIFGLPSELARLLGRASPLAMIGAGITMAIPILCMAEVASYFAEPGGPYLYVRSAFGRFPSVQIGWFHLLAATAGGAASAVLFISYLGAVVSWTGREWLRPFLLLLVIAIPTLANYVGVRSGARLINLLTVSKLLPLIFIIVLGLSRFRTHLELLSRTEITAPSGGALSLHSTSF